MGKDYKRSVGSINHKRRFKTRISVNSSFFRSQRNTCKCSKFTYFTTGGKTIVRKKCDRTCPSARYSESFLFNIFPYPQKDRRFQTSHKSPFSKQVSQETAFQNGLFKQCSEPSSTRRLGNIPRLKRCVYAYSNPPGAQKVPEILHLRQSIPVLTPSV